MQRDCSRRGYTTDEVLAELDRREPDSAAFIRPQERYADMVVSFMPGADPDHLDAELLLRDRLPHPDLSPFIGNGVRGISDERADRVRIPGDIEPERAAEIEEAIWDRLHFATHLRSQRLGEFTIGMDLHRSESLALVQLLILYHLVTGRAAVALGPSGAPAHGVVNRGLRLVAVHEGEELLDRRPERAVRRADHVPLPARQRHVDVDRPEQSELDLEMRRQARLQRDAETRAGGLLDRAVGAERADRRVEIVAGEELLGHRARARALLAQQPRARSELLDAAPGGASRAGRRAP